MGSALRDSLAASRASPLTALTRGPRLTALMPCRELLEPSNPGAAFLRAAGFEVRTLQSKYEVVKVDA